MSGKEQCSPFWSFLAPTLFILLWSGGFTALKAGLAYAEPITYLALRYGVALAVLLPLFLVMRPPLEWRSPIDGLPTHERCNHAAQTIRKIVTFDSVPTVNREPANREPEWIRRIFKTKGGNMAQDPGIGYRVQATITGVKGECSAGHRMGESFDISCHDPGGLCGWFYHDIFPSLSTFQFGGNFPWWEGDTIELRCPDPHNLVTLRLQRFPRG